MKENEVKQKMKQFSGMLESIENLESKKRFLWLEIYENAIIDRMNAYMLFTNIYTTLKGGVAEHVQTGAIMSKYIERMNKSNDQLLKLAELLAKEEEKILTIDSDEIFDKIKE